MTKTIMCVVMLFVSSGLMSQELYVSTEPASNMAVGSMGLRINTKFFKMVNDGKYTYRLNPEIMIGATKRLMLHLNLYGSDMYQPNFRAEGGGVYAKYRFLSIDDVHSHFRMAGFGKLSLVNNPAVLEKDHQSYYSDEIDIDGNTSGFLAGIVATQLSHKAAFSSSVSFVNRLNNLNSSKDPAQSAQAVDYSLSAGYLFLPRSYSDYKQTNFNLYFEVLGSSSLDKKAYYIDVAPAVQFIFNSISRLDLAYRVQVAGNMQRLADRYFLLRFEYNLLNIFGNRK